MSKASVQLDNLKFSTKEELMTKTPIQLDDLKFVYQVTCGNSKLIAYVIACNIASAVSALPETLQGKGDIAVSCYGCVTNQLCLLVDDLNDLT